MPRARPRDPGRDRDPRGVRGHHRRRRDRRDRSVERSREVGLPGARSRCIRQQLVLPAGHRQPRRRQRGWHDRRRRQRRRGRQRLRVQRDHRRDRWRHWNREMELPGLLYDGGRDHRRHRLGRPSRHRELRHVQPPYRPRGRWHAEVDREPFAHVHLLPARDGGRPRRGRHARDHRRRPRARRPDRHGVVQPERPGYEPLPHRRGRGRGQRRRPGDLHDGDRLRQRRVRLVEHGRARQLWLLARHHQRGWGRRGGGWLRRPELDVVRARWHGDLQRALRRIGPTRPPPAPATSTATARPRWLGPPTRPS